MPPGRLHHLPLIRLATLGVLGLLCSLLLPQAGHALPIWSVVNGVSQSSYQQYLDDVLYTHNGDNRGAGPEHDLARTAIYDAFSGFGLDTSLHGFDWGGSGYPYTTYYNVVGIHQGCSRPDEIYILGAHYDSVHNPGADDDGSGVAGVLEAARVLSQYRFQSTIIFIAFDKEEVGLRGSYAYAQEHAADNILGMLELDMIAYNPEGEHHDRVTLYSGRRNWNPDFKESVGDAVALFGNGITPMVRGGIAYSDHQKFEDISKPACLMIEDAMSASPAANPHYHKQTDSVDTPNYIDYLYATNLTRATVGFLAMRAGDMPEPASVVAFAAGLAVLGILMRRRRAAPLPPA